MEIDLEPLADRIIIRAVDEQSVRASGLVIPDVAKEKPQKGAVVAIGPGRVTAERNRRIPVDVAVGDEVLYSKYGGTEIKIDGEDLLILREADVLAILR